MRLLKVECLLVLAAIVLATGCGQNPHVTSADESTATGSNASAVSPQPEEQAKNDQTTPSDNGNPDGNSTSTTVVTAPTGEGSNTTTIIKEKEINTLEPIILQIVLREEAPAPAPQPVPTPTVLNGCWKAESTITEFAGLNPEELQSFRDAQGANLPYFTSSPKNTSFKAKQAKLDILSLGRGNQGTAASPYVKNAMVLFETDMYLPPRNAVVEDGVFDATLNLSLYKRDVEVSTAYDDTEVLCFLDWQKCSGAQFHKDGGGFGNLINPAFGNGQAVLNDRYSKQMQVAIKSQNTKVGGRREWSGTLSLKLSELLTPKGATLSKKELIDTLYSLPEQASGARKLRIVLADDSMVRSASVQMNYTIDSCTAAQK